MLPLILSALALAAPQASAPPAMVAAADAPPAGVLIVLNKAAASADFLDCQSGEKLASLATGEGPHEGLVTPDGHHAVVANYGAETPGTSLAVFDLEPASVLRPGREHDCGKRRGSGGGTSCSRRAGRRSGRGAPTPSRPSGA